MPLGDTRSRFKIRSQDQDQEGAPTPSKDLWPDQLGTRVGGFCSGSTGFQPGVASVTSAPGVPAFSGAQSATPGNNEGAACAAPSPFPYYHPVFREAHVCQ